MKHLFTMNMLQGGFVVDHLNEFNMFTIQLSYTRVNFDGEVRYPLILCSLPKSWNGLVMVVSNYISSSNIVKFVNFFGVILSQEMRWKRIGGTLGNALNAKKKGIQRCCRCYDTLQKFSTFEYWSLITVISSASFGHQVSFHVIVYVSSVLTLY